jgi:hypothetical protein
MATQLYLRSVSRTDHCHITEVEALVARQRVILWCGHLDPLWIMTVRLSWSGTRIGDRKKQMGDSKWYSTYLKSVNTVPAINDPQIQSFHGTIAPALQKYANPVPEDYGFSG